VAYDPISVRQALSPDELTRPLIRAAICELADRAQTGNFSPNLDEVLFPPVP